MKHDKEYMGKRFVIRHRPNQQILVLDWLITSHVTSITSSDWLLTHHSRNRYLELSRSNRDELNKLNNVKSHYGSYGK